MQLSHSYIPAAALEGQAVPGPNTFVDSGVCKEASIPFGKFVVNVVSDANEPTFFESPDATAEITAGRLVGVAIRDESKAFNADGFVQDESMPVLTRGRVWVRTETAITKGAAVFVRCAAAGAEVLGSVRHDADGTDAIALPGAKVVVPGGAGDLVLIELT